MPTAKKRPERREEEGHAPGPRGRRESLPIPFPGPNMFEEIFLSPERGSVRDAGENGAAPVLRRRNSTRKRVQSMDSGWGGIEGSQASETVIGAIVMALKSLKAATAPEIVQKIEPIFGLLRKDPPNSVFAADARRSVEVCLQNNADSLFQSNARTGKWSLRNDSDADNYFSTLELRLAREGKRSSPNRRIRKRNAVEYNAVIDRLQGVLEFVGKSEKLARLVRKNPFKRMWRLNKAPTTEEARWEEDVLADMLSAEGGGSEERLIGILQCFHYFLPLLKRGTEGFGRLPAGAARALTDYLREALATKSA